MWLTATAADALSAGGFQRLGQIGEDIVDMLDADGQTHHVSRHTGPGQLFVIQLPVSGGCRMTGQRFGVADVHQPQNQPQRMMKRAPASWPPLMPKDRIAAGLPSM